jgi:hypothetical protein
VFHSYRSLVAAGAAEPILCPQCLFILITMRDDRDEPTFMCLNCDSRYYVGVKTYNDMKAAIERQINGIL